MGLRQCDYIAALVAALLVLVIAHFNFTCFQEPKHRRPRTLVLVLAAFLGSLLGMMLCKGTRMSL